MANGSNTKFCIDNVKIDRFLPILIGDANDDGIVDENDAAILAEHWLTSSAAVWSMGDFNADGMVNDADATILAANWGRMRIAVSSVPEPSSGLVVFISVMLVSGLLRSYFHGPKRYLSKI